jgi:DNA-directed RNA polymerase specialized sigma24 family protein
METLEMPVRQQATLNREALFRDLYERSFPRVAEFVGKRKGTFQDAKDIFQDALIIYYEKLVEGELSIQLSDEAYVLGISKHLWFRKFGADQKNISLDSITIADDFYPDVNSSRLQVFLERAGKKCMDLLSAFYFHRQSPATIAPEFGYSGERSATVQKFKCIEKLRDIVKQKSMSYDDFTE